MMQMKRQVLEESYTSAPERSNNTLYLALMASRTFPRLLRIMLKPGRLSRSWQSREYPSLWHSERR